MLVAFALLSLFTSLVWDLWRGSGRQAKQVEEGTDLIRAALLLQETLSTDLERALPLRTLPSELTPRGEAFPLITLPLYAGYQGDAPKAILYRPVEYVWNPTTHQVLRNGRVVVREGISSLSFRWTAKRPTMLEIELEGEKSFKKVGTKFSIRLPAPQGTDGLPIWIFASHHRQAELISE
jgi:type II secretory pathway pseudopilin PulG